MNFKPHIVIILFFICCFCHVQGHPDSTLNLKSDSLSKKNKISSFNAYRSVLSENTATCGKNKMEIFIDRRFGSISGDSSLHTLLGIDELSDYRLGLGYGLTDNLQIGIARSKFNELIEGSFKWRFLDQSSINGSPFTIAVYMCAGLTTKDKNALYPLGSQVPNLGSLSHRLSYLSQIMLSKRFGKFFSLQINTGYHHRNLIFEKTNESNLERDKHGTFFGSFLLEGFITKKWSVFADFLHVFSKYQKNNPDFDFNSPLAFGAQYQKSGYVTTFSISNCFILSPLNFIPVNNGSWGKGKINLGLSLSKTLSL